MPLAFCAMMVSHAFGEIRVGGSALPATTRSYCKHSACSDSSGGVLQSPIMIVKSALPNLDFMPCVITVALLHGSRLFMQRCSCSSILRGSRVGGGEHIAAVTPGTSTDFTVQLHYVMLHMSGGGVFKRLVFACWDAALGNIHHSMFYSHAVTTDR